MSSSNSMTFHDFFHDLFKFFKTLGLAVRFKIKTFTCFRAFFDLKQFNRHKVCRSPKCVSFTLLNYSSLSHIFLPLSTAVNNLSNKTLSFYNFQGPAIFHDFPEIEMKLIYSMTFQVFHDLYEPCKKENVECRS